MNKKELAKLLLKHPLIKKINESQMWDRSIVSRIIAEELLAEDEKSAAEMKAAIENLKKEIKESNVKIAAIRGDIKKLASDGDNVQANDLSNYVDALVKEKKEAQEKLKTMVSQYKNLSNRAATTPETEDDVAVQTAAKQDAEKIKAINTELPKQMAAIKNAKSAPTSAKQAAQQVSQALNTVSTDRVEKVTKTMANASSEKEPNQDQNPPKTKGGWKNEQDSVRNFLNNKFRGSGKSPEKAMQELKDALQNVESFRQYFNINESRVSSEKAFMQAKELMDTYIGQRLEKILANNDPEEVKQAASDLVATVSSVENAVDNADVATKAAEALLDSEGIPDSAETLKGILDASSEEKTSGDSDSGQVSPTMIDKWLLDNKLQDLTLFKNEEFKAEFEKLLAQAFASKEVNVELGDDKKGDDFDSGNTPVNQGSAEFTQNTDGVGDSDETPEDKNLKEEADVEEAPPETKTVSPEESAKVREEVDAIIKALSDSGLLTDDLDTLLKKQLSGESDEKGTPEASGEQAGEQDSQKPSISKEEEYKGHIEVFDNFFSLDGANDGFMEQFLLKYQSQKLWQFIGELSKIAMEGEERALSGKPETTAADAETEEEEGTELKTDAPEDANLEEAWNPFKREKEDVVIPKEAKAELKTSLIALLGALKKLRGMTKSYEQNMMKSSANPALDGSSLMAQIQRFLPDIQDSIAKIVERSYESIIEQNKLKDLESEKTEEPPAEEETPAEEDAEEEEVNELLREVFLEEEAGMSREDKIQIVDAKYQEMRQFYMGGFQEILERGDEKQAIPAADKMLKMAREEKFISMFPSALIGKSGKPHSVKEAVVVLSDMIQVFVQTMKDVVMLVKKDVIPAETLSSVVSDLFEISKQLEEYFKVDSKIDPKLKAKLEKFLAKKPENQSLSDIKLPEPSGDLELDDEGGESPFPIQGSEEGEGGETVDDEEVFKRKVDAGVSFFRNPGSSELGEEMESFTNSLFASIPASESIADTAVYRLLSKTILLLMETLEEEGEVTSNPPTEDEVRKFKQSILLANQDKLTQRQKNWILDKVDSGLMKQLYGITKKHYKQLQKEFEPSGARIPISLEEALKPIIAKMLKEHHG